MPLLNKYGSFFFLFVALSVSTLVWADYADPLLTVDRSQEMGFPKHFRTTSDKITSSTPINTSGLSDLHIAGGSEFPQLAIQKMLQQVAAKQIVILDLRLESHGFLNGNAISWYGQNNATNVGKTPEQVEVIQAQLLNELSQHNSVTVYANLKKAADGKVAKAEPMELPVHQVLSEAEMASNAHLIYQRLYIQDYHAPLDSQVDKFITTLKQLPANEWIYFHCRAGAGRTTTFMALYDMMHNAKHVAFNDILARQAALGGIDLRKLPNPSNRKYQAIVDRLAFLKNFYAYCQRNHDNFKTLWTDWLKQQGK